MKAEDKVVRPPSPPLSSSVNCIENHTALNGIEEITT
jgi:hypothetical protein